MIYQEFKDVYTENLAHGAIINDRHTGFKEDYLIIHCLLRRYSPKTVLEIGTNSGYGTMIIKNAVGPKSIVFSLDLPEHLIHLSKQHPVNEGKGQVGVECSLPYIQLFDDSMFFNYRKCPCEAYYIDGEHTTGNVEMETLYVKSCFPNLIIWHDADMPEVYQGIINVMGNEEYYQLYRVTDTRIMYAVKKGGVDA